MYIFHGSLALTSFFVLLIALVGNPWGPTRWIKTIVDDGDAFYGSELMLEYPANQEVLADGYKTDVNWIVIKPTCNSFKGLKDLKELCVSTRIVVPIILILAVINVAAAFVRPDSLVRAGIGSALVLAVITQMALFGIFRAPEPFYIEENDDIGSAYKILPMPFILMTGVAILGIVDVIGIVRPFNMKSKGLYSALNV